MLLIWLTLLSSPWQLLEEEAICTWYGEAFVGRRHAASWHKETPWNFPEVVTGTDYGIAAPIDVPFGTILRLTRVQTCYGETSEYDGRSVIVVVVDRKRNYRARGYFDLWPAAAKRLGFGPEFEDDAGCVKVRVEALNLRAS